MERVNVLFPEHDCPEPGCEAKAGEWCAVLPGGVPWQHAARPLSSWMPGGSSPVTPSEASEQTPAPATPASVDQPSMSSAIASDTVAAPGPHPATGPINQGAMLIALGTGHWLVGTGMVHLEIGSAAALAFYYLPEAQYGIGLVPEDKLDPKMQPDVLIAIPGFETLDIMTHVLEEIRAIITENETPERAN